MNFSAYAAPNFFVRYVFHHASQAAHLVLSAPGVHGSSVGGVSLPSTLSVAAVQVIEPGVSPPSETISTVTDVAFGGIVTGRFAVSSL